MRSTVFGAWALPSWAMADVVRPACSTGKGSDLVVASSDFVALSVLFSPDSFNISVCRDMSLQRPIDFSGIRDMYVLFFRIQYGCQWALSAHLPVSAADFSWYLHTQFAYTSFPARLKTRGLKRPTAAIRQYFSTSFLLGWC